MPLKFWYLNLSPAKNHGGKEKIMVKFLGLTFPRYTEIWNILRSAMLWYLSSLLLPFWHWLRKVLKIVQKCFNADLDSNSKCIIYFCLIRAYFLNISFAVNALLKFLNYWVYTPYEKESVAPTFSTDKKFTYVEPLFRYRV